MKAQAASQVPLRAAPLHPTFLAPAPAFDAFSGAAARVLALPVIGCYFAPAQFGSCCCILSQSAAASRGAGGETEVVEPQVQFSVAFNPFSWTWGSPWAQPGGQRSPHCRPALDRGPRGPFWRCHASVHRESRAGEGTIFGSFSDVSQR